MPSDLVLIGTSDSQGICYIEVSMDVHVFADLDYVSDHLPFHMAL